MSVGVLMFGMNKSHLMELLEKGGWIDVLNAYADNVRHLRHLEFLTK